MRYLKFTIENYRAIVGPLEIDLEKHALMPIIGVNECGKTTILQAIFAFDAYNDGLNDDGRHLRDVSNLYRTSSESPVVSALIELSASEFTSVLDAIAKKNEELTSDIRAYRRRSAQFPSRVTIRRNLTSKEYRLEVPGFTNEPLNRLIVNTMISWLPYILYFDDFRDAVEERVAIAKDTAGRTSGWLATIEQLFRQTDPSFSVFTLGELEERKRKSVLAKVKRKLGETLTSEWQNFRLDDTDALQVSIDYETEGSGPAKKEFLRLEVIETDTNGDEHFFFIRDRSKGFYWFFNFVMKLEFNPKSVASDHYNAIYLLDEPGSYLHASAQSKLCQKLKQLSSGNRVIYCTHSHYLLDPDVIPLGSIHVAEKGGTGDVHLASIHEHPGNIVERRSAFQPVVDALQIKPFLLDLSHRRIVITEGIVDFYAFETMKETRAMHFLPSVGADSIQYYISLMIAWRVPYRALWDNDDQGRKAHARAVEVFGEEEAGGRFYLLQGPKRTSTVLQDLFEGADIALIKSELGLPRNTSFAKLVTALYYSPNRDALVSRLSSTTRGRFAAVLDLIAFPEDEAAVLAAVREPPRVVASWTPSA